MDQMNSLKQHWEEEGYILVKGLLDSARMGKLRAICEAVLKQWREKCPLTGKAGIDTPDASSMRHLNHPGYAEVYPSAVAEILKTTADPEFLKLCRLILGDEPMFRSTSLFMNPLETSLDGNWHRDTQFLYPDEEEEKRVVAERGAAGTSIQLQVALVPSSDIEVVPGSHLRWDTEEEYAIRRADEGARNRSNAMPNALRVEMEAGDAVVFNPVGLHRGRYHTDRLRRTLMLTYTSKRFPRSDFFSYQPWFLEENYLDGLSESSRQFYQQFIDQYRSYLAEAEKPSI